MNKEGFMSQWREHFTPDISNNFYNSKMKKGFLWHVFSYEKIDSALYLKGKQARQAYNQQRKNDALVFRLWDKNETVDMNEQFNTAEKLDELPETYVIAKDFSWTYLSTHEQDWDLGPYFMEKSNKKKEGHNI